MPTGVQIATSTRFRRPAAARARSRTALATGTITRRRRRPLDARWPVPVPDPDQGHDGRPEHAHLGRRSPRTRAAPAAPPRRRSTSSGPPSLATSFGAASIVVGNNYQLSFTITQPNAVDLTGVAFSDTLPAGLTVATPNNLSTTCGGAVTAVAGSSSISLSGATVPRARLHDHRQRHARRRAARSSNTTDHDHVDQPHPDRQHGQRVAARRSPRRRSATGVRRRVDQGRRLDHRHVHDQQPQHLDVAARGRLQRHAARRADRRERPTA